MQPVNYKLLLNQLAAFMAAGASIEFEDTPRGLWTHRLIEDRSTLVTGDTLKPASVLRFYGGDVPVVPLPFVQVQCMTTSLKDDDESGQDQASALHGALLDAGGRTLRMQSITDFRISVLSLGVPAQIGRDEKERALWVFNFDVEVVPLA